MWKMVNKYYWEINSNIWIFYFRSTWRIKYILEALPKNGKHFNNRNHHSPWMSWWLGASPCICLVYQLLHLWGTELRQTFLKDFSFFPLLFFSFCIFFLSPPPFFFFFWLYHMACRILVPQPGTKNLPPLYWKFRVLTTGLPGKSLERFF